MTSTDEIREVEDAITETVENLGCEIQRREKREKSTGRGWKLELKLVIVPKHSEEEVN